MSDSAWTQRLRAALERTPLVRWEGRVQGLRGQIINATLPQARIGDLCTVERAAQPALLAEIVGLHETGAYLAPLGEITGVSLGARVESTARQMTVRVGEQLLGRIVDGFGHVQDGAVFVSPPDEHAYAIDRLAPLPSERTPIGRPFNTGVRVVDALLTCGMGQRMGIFAGPGVGKSTLLGMLLRHSSADVVVLALVGERGREVREFIENEIGPQAMARTVLVVATSDRPAVERARACFVATTIAEYFRDTGRHVLLMVDSLTRYARAQREIGLAAGEPPTRGSYPPSVFSNLPRIVERAGATSRGCITAFYTVLVEGDEIKGDPVAEEVQSLLDGHILLSRVIASRGQYPAVDPLRSISRVMSNVASREHQRARMRFCELLSKFEQTEFLVQIGEYKHGSDAVADEAIEKIEKLRRFMAQDRHSACSPEASLQELFALVSPGEGQ